MLRFLTAGESHGQALLVTIDGMPAGLPVDIPPEISPQRLIGAMEIDKKAAGGKIKFVMCEGLGRTRFDWLAPDEILRGLAP